MANKYFTLLTKISIIKYLIGILFSIKLVLLYENFVFWDIIIKYSETNKNIIDNVFYGVIVSASTVLFLKFIEKSSLYFSCYDLIGEWNEYSADPVFSLNIDFQNKTGTSNIKFEKDNLLTITHCHRSSNNSSRKWEGEISLDTRTKKQGTINWKYDDNFEFGTKSFFIIKEKSYIYLIITTNNDGLKQNISNENRIINDEKTTNQFIEPIYGRNVLRKKLK